MTIEIENKLLKNWKLKLGLILLIIGPPFSVAKAYFALEAKIAEQRAAVEQRISEIQLGTEKDKADKSALQSLQNEVKGMRDDLTTIKTILCTRSQRGC